MADFSKFIEQMKEFDVNNIDFNRIGVWPAPVKIFLCLLAVVLINFGCYHLSVKDKQMTLQREVGNETALKSDFERKAHEAANLEKYREQMVQMEASFGALVSRLPTEVEVSDLLVDVDGKGEDARLTIEKMDLQKEVPATVHIETPFKIIATGGYHEFGAFVSGIAGMPRIVTLHDFKIEPNTKQSGLLSMLIDAKTYRYKAQE